MKKKNYRINAPLHTRSEWPRVPAPRGYVYNIEGALINWPYAEKKMKETAPDVFAKLENEYIVGASKPNLQETFIRFCEWYEMDTGDDFELNLIRGD